MAEDNKLSNVNNSSTPIDKKEAQTTVLPSFAQRDKLFSGSSSSTTGQSSLLDLATQNSSTSKTNSTNSSLASLPSSLTGLKTSENTENKNGTLGIIGRTVSTLPTSALKGVTSALDKIADAPSYIDAQLAQRRVDKNPTSNLAKIQNEAAQERYQKAADTHLLGDTVNDWEKKVDERQASIMTDNPNSKAAEIGYKATELAESAGRMVPGIVASAVTGGILGAATGATELAASAAIAGKAVPTAVKVVEGVSSAVGLGTMWAEVYSSSIDQSMAEGRDFTAAGDKAFGDATLEVATELMFGGIAGLGKTSWANSLSSKIGNSSIIKGLRKTVGDDAAGTALSQAISKVPAFMSTKFGKTLFGDIATSGELGGMVGEALEEMVSEFVSPYIERATTNPEAENATLGQILEAGLGGAILSGVMAPLGTVQENIQYNKTVKSIQKWAQSDANAIAVLNTAVNSGLTGDIQAEAVHSFVQDVQLKEMREYSALDADLVEQVAVPEYVEGVTTHQDVTDAFARYTVAIKEQTRRNMEKAAAGQYKPTLETVVSKNDNVVKASEELDKAKATLEELKKIENPTIEQTAKIAEAQSKVVEASANLTKARQEARANIENDLAKAYADGTMLSTYGEDIYEQYKAYRFVEEQKSIPAADPTKGRVALRIKDGTVTNDTTVPLQSFTRDELSKALYNGIGYKELNEKQLTDLENEIKTYMANEKSRISTEQQAIKDEINKKLEENGSTMRVEFESLGEGLGAEWRDGKVIFNSDRVINRNMANYYLGHEVIHDVFNQFRQSNNIKGLEQFKKDLQTAMFYSGFSFDQWFNSQAMQDKYLPRFFNEEIAIAARGLKLSEKQLDKILNALSTRNYKNLTKEENRAISIATENAKARYNGGEYIKFDAETGEESKITVDSSGEEEVYAKFSAYLFGANNLINRLSSNYKEMLGYMGAAAQRSAIKDSTNKGLAYAQAKVTDTIAQAINNAEQTETPVNSSEVSGAVNADILLNAPSIYDENFYPFDYTLLPKDSNGWNTQMWGDYWEKVLPAVGKAWDEKYQEEITLDPAIAKLASRTHPIFRDSDNRLRVLYHGTPEAIVGWTEFQLKDLDKGVFSADSYDYIVANDFVSADASEFRPFSKDAPVFTEAQLKAGVKTEEDAIVFAQKTGIQGGYYRLYLFSSNPIVINNRFVETPYAQVSSVMDEFTNGKYQRPQLEEELKPIAVTTLSNKQLKSIADSIVKTAEGREFAGTDSYTLYDELNNWVDYLRSGSEEAMQMLETVMDGAGGILGSYVVELPEGVKFSTIQKSTAYSNNLGTSAFPVTIDGKNYVLINALGGYLDAEDFVGRTLSANKKEWGKLFNVNNISSVFHDPTTLDGDTLYEDYNGPSDRVPGYTNIDYLMAAARKVGKDAVFVWNVIENNELHNEAIGDYSYIKSIYNADPTLTSTNIMADELLGPVAEKLNVLYARTDIDYRDNTYSILTRAIARRHPSARFSTSNLMELVKYLTKPSNVVTFDEIKASGIIPWMQELNRQGVKSVSTGQIINYLVNNEKNFIETKEDSDGSFYGEYTTANGKNRLKGSYQEWTYVQPDLHYPNEQRHWNRDSVALHIREQQFNTTDGKNVTVIEEIQSDPGNDASKANNSNSSKDKANIQTAYGLLNNTKSDRTNELNDLKEKLKANQKKQQELKTQYDDLFKEAIAAREEYWKKLDDETNAALEKAKAEANINSNEHKFVDVYNKSTAPKVILKVADNILNYWRERGQRPQATVNSALKYLKNSDWVRNSIKNSRYDRTSWWLKGLTKSECNRARYYLFYQSKESSSLSDLKRKVLDTIEYSEEVKAAEAKTSQLFDRLNAINKETAALHYAGLDIENIIKNAQVDDLYSSGDNLLHYGIRRAIQHAIDNNSDYIAVTTPDSQSERYGEWSISNEKILKLVSKEIKNRFSIDYGDENYTLSKTDPIILTRNWLGAKDILGINDIYGFLWYYTDKKTNMSNADRLSIDGAVLSEIQKEMQENGGTPLYEVLGIKALKSYTHEYREKIPSYLKNYGEQFGAKLVDVYLDTAAQEEYPVKALEINDEMRQSIINNGQRRFESTDTDAELYRQWQAAQNRYGTYGEDGVPKRTVDGKKVSEFAQNIYTDETNSPKFNAELRKITLEGMMSYTPITDKDAMATAHSWLNRYNKTDNNGNITLDLEQAIGDYLAAGLRGENANKYAIAKGQLLMKTISQKGDNATDVELNLWSKLASSLAADSPRVASATQAYSLLKKTTPDGRLFYIQRCLDNLKQDFKNRKDTIFEKASVISSKLDNYTIPDNLLQALREAKTVEELDTAEQNIVDDIAKQIPASIETRLTAWRYLSMLGNVRTHERNIISNAAMWIARNIKDKTAGVTEDVFIKDGIRTKTARRASAEIKAFSNNDYTVMKDALTFGGKMGFETKVSQARKSYGNTLVGRFLEALGEFNSNLLEGEDAFFLKLTYREALANYLTANNYTVEFLESKTEAANEALGNARDYAINEAQKATYREANELASFLNRMEKKSSVNALIIGGLVPYKRTPMNIFKRGLEYSPVGIATGVKELLVDVRSGKVTAAEGIDRLCAGLTGTMILALGMFLAGAGLMKAGGSDDKKEEYYDEMVGNQKYSITIGDTNYTLDWLTPISMPLFAGVELMTALSDTDDGESNISFNDILDTLGTMTDPLTNLSLLQGINDALDAYGDSNKLGQLALSAGESYVSQFIPTLAGQVARTIDPTRRSTYAPKDSTALGGSEGEKFLNRLKSKLPFLSSSNEAYVDMWGRTEERSGNILQRAVDQMLVPWYSKVKNSTAVDDVLSEIFAETGDSSILPSTPNSYFTINGETKYLSAKDYTEVKQIVGQLSYKGVEQALGSNYFTKLTSDEQSDVIGNIYSFARAYAKYNYATKYGLTIDADSNIAKVEEAMSLGLSLGDYFIIKKLVGSVQSEKDSKGKTISGSKKRRQMNLMSAYGLTQEQMNIFL